MTMFTSSTSPQQPMSTDPAEVWDKSKGILFHVAKKVRQAVRLKLDGSGRGEAEPWELVNDSFACLMEALPRFDPKKAKFSTFVYGLARRRMWLVARAAFFGISPQQLHRMDAAKRTPRFHYDVDSRRCQGRSRGFAAKVKCRPEADGEPCPSIHRVEELRRQLPRKERRLVDLYLQEDGNMAAVARRLGKCRQAISTDFYRMFCRIRASA